jgi:hypothetical protein
MRWWPGEGILPSKVVAIEGPLVATCDNMEALFKIFQPVPDGTMDYLSGIWDVKDPNHVTITIACCLGLSFFDRKRPEKLDLICHDTEVKYKRAYADAENPYIEMNEGSLRRKTRPKYTVSESLSCSPRHEGWRLLGGLDLHEKTSE